MVRLTKDVIAKILADNEGYRTSTHYSAKNLKQTCHYLIEGGKLLIRCVGKTSWSDSHFDEPYSEASLEQTRRFIRNNRKPLNVDE